MLKKELISNGIPPSIYDLLECGFIKSTLIIDEESFDSRKLKWEITVSSFCISTTKESFLIEAEFDKNAKLKEITLTSRDYPDRFIKYKSKRRGFEFKGFKECKMKYKTSYMLLIIDLFYKLLCSTRLSIDSCFHNKIDLSFVIDDLIEFFSNKDSISISSRSSSSVMLYNPSVMLLASISLYQNFDNEILSISLIEETHTAVFGRTPITLYYNTTKNEFSIAEDYNGIKIKELNKTQKEKFKNISHYIIEYYKNNTGLNIL